MHVLQVPTQIAALREILLANLTFERSRARVLSEVVPQITALLKNAFAIFEAALEVELDALGLGIPHFDGLVPLFGNALKGVGVDVVRLARRRVIQVHTNRFITILLNFFRRDARFLLTRARSQN